MEATKVNSPEEKLDQYEETSLKGTLFSSLVFVGGGIIFFIVLLFVVYMIRV
ncbi:hypothetical protein QGM71_09185 [Virgibacillus sp. C22-A2]|uniref:YqzM family protein n=1 Tax=Virgibacillus tibetensis TaxID=3042313 RepID=A0ABU6KGT7_9BACI|nr:hypothetical protein [Virgibacillus sp. C22-A2]